MTSTKGLATMNQRHDSDSAPPLGRLETITLVAVVGVLALTLGLAAVVMPSAAWKTQKAPYAQSGKFSYSAETPASSLYGIVGLSTGQPILSEVVGPVTAGFVYKFQAKTPTDISGTAGMVAVVKLDQGFTKRFTVAPTVPFTGSTTSISGLLPIDAIIKYVDAASASLNAGTIAATITLQPQIKASGTVGANKLKTSYAPSLPFALSGDTLTVSNASPAADPSGAAPDPLKPSKAGNVTYRTQVTNTMPLPIMHPSVPAARGIGLGTAGVCLLLVLWLARPLLQGDRTTGEQERIRALYGSQLVPVTEFTVEGGPIAEVASISALADLAKRYESMIMHLSSRAGDSYLVWDNGMLYRYRPHWQTITANAGKTASSPSEDEPSRLKHLPRGRMGAS